MPQGISAGPQRPTRPGSRPARRRLPTCLSTASAHPGKRPAWRGQFSPPGTAPLELQQHGEQLGAAEPGPPRSQPHRERAGRLPQAVPRLPETGHSVRADRPAPPAGPAGKAAALNPARSCRTLGSTGRASCAAAPVISARGASASARAGMLRDGGRRARRSHRPGAGLVAAGVEGQRGGEQCGGDDRPQHQHGLLPAQPRAQAARLRAGCAPARVRRARRGR